jgi:hypothetical protein
MLSPYRLDVALLLSDLELIPNQTSFVAPSTCAIIVPANRVDFADAKMSVYMGLWLLPVDAQLGLVPGKRLTIQILG